MAVFCMHCRHQQQAGRHSTNVNSAGDPGLRYACLVCDKTFDIWSVARKHMKVCGFQGKPVMKDSSKKAARLHPTANIPPRSSYQPNTPVPEVELVRSCRPSPTLPCDAGGSLTGGDNYSRSCPHSAPWNAGGCCQVVLQGRPRHRGVPQARHVEGHQAQVRGLPFQATRLWNLCGLRGPTQAADLPLMSLDTRAEETLCTRVCC